MSEAAANLPSWEALASQRPWQIDDSNDMPMPVQLHILAASWNAPLVAEALSHALKGLRHYQTLLPEMHAEEFDQTREGKTGIIAEKEIDAVRADLRRADGLESSIPGFDYGGVCWQCDLVPGSLELPQVASNLAWSSTRSSYSRSRSQGILAIGVVIRGETQHFNLVSRECANGLSKVAQRTGVPVISGLLAVENEEQAKARVSQGDAWARSLIQMVLLAKKYPRKY